MFYDQCKIESIFGNFSQIVVIEIGSSVWEISRPFVYCRCVNLIRICWIEKKWWNWICGKILPSKKRKYLELFSLSFHSSWQLLLCKQQIIIRLFEKKTFETFWFQWHLRHFLKTWTVLTYIFYKQDKSSRTGMPIPIL